MPIDLPAADLVVLTPLKFPQLLLTAALYIYVSLGHWRSPLMDHLAHVRQGR